MPCPANAVGHVNVDDVDTASVRDGDSLLDGALSWSIAALIAMMMAGSDRWAVGSNRCG